MDNAFRQYFFANSLKNYSTLIEPKCIAFCHPIVTKNTVFLNKVPLKYFCDNFIFSNYINNLMYSPSMLLSFGIVIALDSLYIHNTNAIVAVVVHT